MDERQHTPEPWKAVKVSQFDEAEIIDSRGNAFGVLHCSDGADEALDFPGRANAERIVDCVNACEGMADPQATIRALVEAAKHAVMEWRLHGQLTDSCRVLEAALALVPPAAQGEK